MKKLEHQLQRLLRAAATAPSRPDDDPVSGPSGRWLLRQRNPAEMALAAAVRPVLQGGLAVVCLLLLVMSLVNVRDLRRTNQDVFAGPEAVLTHLVTP